MAEAMGDSIRGGIAELHAEPHAGTGAVRISEAEDELRVVVHVPEVASMSDLDLTLTSSHLDLSVRNRHTPIHVDFPAAAKGTPPAHGCWDYEMASAKFSKRRHELTVTLRRLVEPPTLD